MNDLLYNIEVEEVSGKKISLDQFRGKTILVVNTASKCGFTPQFEELEMLYKEYKDQGLVILGFPCDQFANQEFNSDDQIQNFCRVNYGVTFPVFKKVKVNGPDAHPLFQLLKKALPGFLGGGIKWNFTKFLVGPDGTPLKRYAPTVKPSKIQPDIKKLL